MPPSVTSHYTTVEELKIHYLSAGSEGEVILFLHGWPTSAYLWRNILPDLGKRHRAIAIDLPGFGKSDKRLEDSYSFRFYKRIIDGFWTTPGIDTVTLGVHDLGGPLGLYWAVQDKTKINRLILLNTLVYPEVSWAVKLFGAATFTPGIRSILTSPAGIRRAMKFGVHQKGKLTDEIIQNYQAPFKDKLSRKILLKTVHGLSPKGWVEIAEKFPLFRVPVQIVYGEKDRVLPKVKDTMERVKKDLPQANIVSFADCGHFLQEEASDRISQVLVEFMKTPS